MCKYFGHSSIIFLRYKLTTFLVAYAILSGTVSKANVGYGLWLDYKKIEDTVLLSNYRNALTTVSVLGDSPTTELAREELGRGLSLLLDRNIQIRKDGATAKNRLIVATIERLDIQDRRLLESELVQLQHDGFLLKEVKNGQSSSLFVIGKNDLGVLYGVFHLLRILQTHGELDGIDQLHAPKLQWRMLNHWDNLNRTVERGYAGLSIWNWDELPGKIDQRYLDYARANASIGINAVALNNVNASPQILSPAFLEKVTAIADVFRPYGIRVFISINFASPRVLGKLDTADPMDEQVKNWWKERVETIYKQIPDFGGFLVKANSEGQPGPQDYGRTHADGANMLAAALAPHNGLLIWRAFVYEARNEDRVKDAYSEFVNFDGQFLPNVMLQTKNGPLDFQPREPFSPLFGALPRTSQMMEFQITQEYLGFSTHLVYLASLYKEVLESDTYAQGKGSTVAHVIDGSLQGQRHTGMAGVANIGDSPNWTGHPFGQSNWYAYGRLAWDHQLSAQQLADEWIRMTLTTDSVAISLIRDMMMSSYEHLVNYQTPLGLTVLSSLGHHYGPQPWRRKGFHKADDIGLGFDRSGTGSAAVDQYFKEVRDSFNNMESCPEELLAWFHHVPWGHTMKSGRTFWEELCHAYHAGVEGVREMQSEWRNVQTAVNPLIHKQVKELLIIQEDEAVWWRDACLWYFGQFSKLEIPAVYEAPRYHEKDFKSKEDKSKSLKHYSTE